MERRPYPLWMVAMRGACIFLCFIILSSSTAFVMKALTALGHKLLAELPNFIIYIICSISSVLIFNSLELAFSTSNKTEIEKYIERDNKKVTLFGEIKNIFSSADSAVEIFVTILLVALSATLGAFSYISGMFEEIISLGIWFDTLTLTAICFITSILAKYESARHMRKLYIENNIDKILSPSWFIGRMVLIFILYPTVMPLSPLLAYMIYSFAAIIIKISALLTVIGTVAAIILLIFLIWGIAVLRGIVKRRKFFKKLHALAKEKGYSLYDISHPYRSYATSKDFCTFFLKCGTKVYACLMISTLHRMTPLIFESAAGAYFLHRIGTKDHGFSIKNNIEFYTPEGGEKIVIISPSPRKVYAKEYGAQKRLYCADKIWNFTVHDDESFLASAERECLDKNSRGKD